MMVAECHGVDVFGIGREVYYHLARRRDAGDEQYVFVGRYCAQRPLLAAIYGMQRVVVECGEVEMLVRVEAHGLGDDAELHRFEVARTFGYDDNVRTVLSRERFAQASGGQQLVVDDKPVVVDEQDVDAGFYIAVLEGIVKQHHIDVLARLVFCQSHYAVAAVFVHGNGHIGIFLFHLVRLVADVFHRRFLVCQNESACLPLVTAAEHRYMELVLQESYQIFHMGGLARSPHGYVANRYHWYVKTAAFQYSHFKECVAQSDEEAVCPAKWQQPVVYLDEVSFHAVSFKIKGLTLWFLWHVVDMEK